MSEELRRSRVERIVKHGANISRNKAAGPVARVMRDAFMPLAFKFFGNEEKFSWLYDSHIDWNSSTRAI